jgi:hypothetical protein
MLFFYFICYNLIEIQIILHRRRSSMKLRSALLSLVLVTSLFAGCAKQNTPAPAASTPAPTEAAATPAPTQAADAVSSASVVDNAADFEKAISKDGTWIIAITKDVTSDKELVVDGEFKNGKKDDKGNELYQRKIGLYTQDENRKVTARFTLTAPKITFNSPFGSIEHGNFKGDLYIAGKNFKLVNAKVDGNIYFLNEEAQKTFSIADKDGDEKTVVTGVQELKK